MAELNNVESDLDSHDARLDFENVLQEIIEKANAEEKLPSDLEEEGKDGDSSNEDTNKEQKSSNSSPQKPSTPKVGKKRRRRDRDDPKDEAIKQSPYVMKLFDRCVDLAPFTDETPLYPICRAWMENDPHKKNAHRHMNGNTEGDSQLDDDLSENEDTSTVRKIPRPNKPWTNVDKHGKYHSPRIPTPISQPKHNYENSAAPPAETLLLNHLQHWKKVRQSWKAKSIENEERYKEGMNTLLDMFYRSTNSNSQ